MVFLPRRLEGSALPHRLRDLEAPPERLWLVGELPHCPAVAIVGTREATRDAISYARHLAAELGAAGAAIFSGGADGIDTAAHEGALAAGAPTVVVAPSAFDRPFPEHNGALFERIVRAGGAHLTAEPPHAAAANHKFFPRNSYLVALAHIVVVVESPLRSGARNAAKWARRLGRPLFVAPAVPWNPQGGGCIAELKLGARPLYSPKDILRELALARLHCLPLSDPWGRAAHCPPPRAPTLAPERVRAHVPARVPVPACAPARARAHACASPRRSRPCQRRRRRPAPPAAPVQQTLGISITYEPGSPAERVLAAVARGARDVDSIAADSGLEPTKVAELLLTLALDGVLVADPSGGVKFVTR